LRMSSEYLTGCRRRSRHRKPPAVARLQFKHASNLRRRTASITEAESRLLSAGAGGEEERSG
jgi:hypothetical protein